MFYKVISKYYSGEVTDVYIIMWQIYSEHYTANLITISQVYRKYDNKHFG